MSANVYQPPTLRAMAGGCLLALLVLVPLIFVSNVVKYVGYAFLVAPQTLGLLPRVSAEEVRGLDLAASPTVIDLPRAGPYLVYCDNYELLEITLMLETEQALPWISLRGADSGAAVPVEFVARGLMPYDSLLAPGRPIFRFVVPQAGAYQVRHLTREAAVVILPDTTTGAEAEMLLSAVIELAILATVLQWVIGRRRKERADRIEALLAPGRISPKDLQREHAEKNGGRPDR